MYDEIYSPEALHQDANTRNSRARSLIADLKEIINDTDSYEVRSVRKSSSFDRALRVADSLLENEFLQERRRVLGNTIDNILI